MNRIRRFADYVKENKDRQVDPKQLVLDHCETLYALALIAFAVSPAYQFFSNLIVDRNTAFNGFYTYNYTVFYFIWFAIILAVASAVVCRIKAKTDGPAMPKAKRIPMYFFLAFCLCIIISTCINGFTIYVFEGYSGRYESIFSFLSYFLAFYFCGSLIKSESKKRAVIIAYLVSNAIIDLACRWHIFIKPIGIWEYSDHDAPSAVFYQFNHYGYFLMLAIVISAALFVAEKRIKTRIFAAVMLALNTFILSMNTTFGCFLACIVGLVFLIFADSVVNRRFSFAAFAMFALFMSVTFLAGLKYHSFFNELGLFFTDIKSVMGSMSEDVVDAANEQAQSAVPAASAAADSAGTGRWGLWRNTIGYIRERPVFGWGIEGIAERLYEDSAHLNNRPHNEYMQYAAFFGIPAALIYIGGVASVFIGAWRSRKRMGGFTVACLAAAVTYAFSAIFGNTMFYTAPFFFIFLGLTNNTASADAESEINNKL